MRTNLCFIANNTLCVVYYWHMSTAKSKKRILVQVDLGQKAARDLLGGVLRYATLQHDWDVRIHRGHPKNHIPDTLLKWHPQGIITDVQIRQATVSRMIRNGLKGIVALHDDNSRGVPLHFVGCDNAQIGEEGAKLLLNKKIRHFGYVPSVIPDAALDRRQDGFVRCIESHGFNVSIYKTHMSAIRGKDISTDDMELAEWLASLPKPCGIMAVFDQRAKNVLDACRLAGIEIPSHCLILGVDNEEYICENVSPTLSSILPDFNGGGFQAAKILDRIIDGETSNLPILSLYGVRKIEERTSTMDLSGTIRSVVLASEFIRRNATLPIGIDEIAAASGTSKRLLEKHFRAVLNTTAAHELQRIRLGLVKKCLEETDIPLGHVGDNCGFNDEFYLKRLFKRTFGMTMGAYRNASRHHLDIQLRSMAFRSKPNDRPLSV